MKSDYGARSNGVECPNCGSPKTPVRISGHGDTGKRYRRRRCYHCRHGFTTIEVAIPDEVSWGSLCTSAREVRRQERRSRYGWTPRPEKYGETADVDVKVKVYKINGFREREQLAKD